MTPQQNRLALGLASTLLSVGLAFWIWDSRPQRDTVELVDTRVSGEQLFAEREARKLEPRGENVLAAHAPLTLGAAQKLFPSLLLRKGRFALDPQTYYWPHSNGKRQVNFAEHPKGVLDVSTNGQGFRKNKGVRELAPDLRILVTGDSHTEGVVSNSELFTELLEAQLASNSSERSVEVLNAGKGGYSFYNYLGVLEKFASLKPDVFVVTVYGGNDFKESVRPRRYFTELSIGPALKKRFRQPLAYAATEYHAIVSQFLSQVLMFVNSEEQEQIARAAGLELIEAIEELCQESGVQFVLVYLPPAHDVQKRYIESMVEGVQELFRFEPGALNKADELATELLAHSAELGIPSLDLRDSFREADEFLYWESDHHLNVRGHQWIAEQLTPLIEALQPY
ncbi:MAG: lysophospholipase L1-like esterase [Planctomycetota bacterium]|jgi:lysophospholipase L1-like esterase